MKTTILILGIAAMALPAGSDPPGFALWTAAQLKGYEKQLAPKINAQKVATQQLGKYDNHLFMVAHREGDGEAELHETQADVFIVQSGRANLVVGGTVVDAKTTAPGEVRGPSIQGGEKKALGPGDVVHIPARVPHQVLLDGNKQFTYAVVKVDSK